MVQDWGVHLQACPFQCLPNERFHEKKSCCSFGFCRNYLLPPFPHLDNLALFPLFVSFRARCKGLLNFLTVIIFLKEDYCFQIRLHILLNIKNWQKLWLYSSICPKLRAVVHQSVGILSQPAGSPKKILLHMRIFSVYIEFSSKYVWWQFSRIFSILDGWQSGPTFMESSKTKYV